MPYPELEQVRLDFKTAKKALRDAGVPPKLITSIETKAPAGKWPLTRRFDLV